MSSRVFRITDGFGKVKFIGHLNGTTLHIEKERSKHFFRRLNAWCLDADIFGQNEDIEVLVIKEKDSDQRYMATRETIESMGETINYPGHGSQVALALKHWIAFTVGEGVSA